MKIRLIAGTEHKYIAEALLEDRRTVISKSLELLFSPYLQPKMISKIPREI